MLQNCMELNERYENYSWELEFELHSRIQIGKYDREISVTAPELVSSISQNNFSEQKNQIIDLNFTNWCHPFLIFFSEENKWTTVTQQTENWKFGRKMKFYGKIEIQSKTDHYLKTKKLRIKFELIKNKIKIYKERHLMVYILL